jgi:hypothetical protein
MLNYCYSRWYRDWCRIDQKSRRELFCFMILVRGSPSCDRVLPETDLPFLSSGNLLSIVFVLGQPRFFCSSARVVALLLYSFSCSFSQCKMLSAPLQRRTHYLTCTARLYSMAPGCSLSVSSLSSSKENWPQRNANWASG